MIFVDYIHIVQICRTAVRRAKPACRTSLKRQGVIMKATKRFKQSDKSFCLNL